MSLYSQIMDVLDNEFPYDDGEPTSAELSKIEEENVDSWDMIVCRGCGDSFSMLECVVEGENFVCPHCGVRNG